MRIHSLALYLVLPAICVSCWVDRYGVLGANFRLAKDSRAPIWVKNASKEPNGNLDIKIWIYESGKTRIIVSLPGIFGKKIQEGLGSYRWHSDSLKEANPGLVRPNWIVIKVNGTEEVYENRESNDKLWIVDKPI